MTCCRYFQMFALFSMRLHYYQILVVTLIIFPCSVTSEANLVDGLNVFFFNSGSGSGNGSGSGSGNIPPHFTGCPTSVLERQVVLNSNILNVPLTIIGLNDENGFHTIDLSSVGLTLTSSRVLTNANITRDPSGLLVLFLDMNDFLLNSSVLVSFCVFASDTSGGMAVPCNFSVEVTAFDASVCINPQPSRLLLVVLYLESIDLTLQISQIEVNDTVIEIIANAIALGMNVICYESCASCGFTSTCRFFFQHCSFFTSADVYILAITAASPSTTTITLALVPPNHAPLLSNNLLFVTAVPGSTISSALLGNQMNFARATGLNIVDVTPNTILPTSVKMFALIAVIVVPVVVVGTVATLVGGVTAIVTTAVIKKHIAMKNKIKPRPQMQEAGSRQVMQVETV